VHELVTSMKIFIGSPPGLVFASGATERDRRRNAEAPRGSARFRKA